jgi:myo-inositol-1(or 4)-monophosphatase
MTAFKPGELEAALDFAVTVAREAGEILMDLFRDPSGAVDYKGEIDLVTRADRESEKHIVQRLRAQMPKLGILAEEGTTVDEQLEKRWIIDPLDGTTNFAHRFPWFSISIALELRGEILAGLVFNPVLDEMFTAVKGQGAYLNGGPIRVSDTPSLDKSMLVTGFPYDIRENPWRHTDVFRAFVHTAQAVRRVGSAAIDLCYVACGRFDGFWEAKLKPWDTAAGSLVLTEAGGRLTDYQGEPYCIYLKQIVASNGLIHEQMLKVIDRVLKEHPKQEQHHL